MSQKTGHKISQRKAKRNFTTIGLILLIYVILVMVVPYVMVFYMEATNSIILNDHFLYYGIYLIIILFGTLIPFFILRKFSKIRFKRLFRKVEASFSDLFVQTIVLFTICIALTYVSNILISYTKLDGKLISCIGFSFDEANLSDHLYVFMLLVVAPLLEEYAFRGVLLTSLSKYGKRFALFASSLLFAFAHNNFAEMIPAFAMGYLLGKYSLKYRSIQPTIIIHILFNVFMYGLCVLPISITKYMTYLLLLICASALYLILSGRYELIHIQKSISNRITNNLFYSRFTIVLSIIIMLTYTILMSMNI